MMQQMRDSEAVFEKQKREKEDEIQREKVRIESEKVEMTKRLQQVMNESNQADDYLEVQNEEL